MRRLALIALILCANCSVPAICANVSNLDNVSYSIISPVDKSLWIATSDRGILRLGSGGKCFVYSAAKGDFPSDSIAALAFDEHGRLWMKDCAGRVFDYSSLDGFVQRSSAPDGLFVITEDVAGEAEVPSQDVAEGKTSILLWIIALLSLMALAGYIVVSRRGKSLPHIKPTPKAQTSEPQQKTVERHIVSKPDVSFYNTVMSLIMENLSNPDFSVEDIAAATGLSRIHVNRKLKAECNLSPSAILKAERMKKASELILSGELPVTEIAAKCGFSSQAYFSSAFKEYFGVSPSSYR